MLRYLISTIHKSGISLPSTLGLSILDQDLIADKNLFLLVMPNAGFVFKKSRLKAKAVLAEHAGSHPGGITMYNNLFFNPPAFFTSR